MSWLDEPSPPTLDFTTHGRISRVELIDHRSDADKPGRVYVANGVDNTLISFQDDGRTLKVFIS